jgi:pyruvate kinase
MNFSHGSYEYHQSVIDNSRAAATKFAGRPIAIALDTKGPEIRTGLMANDADVSWLTLNSIRVEAHLLQVPISAGHEFWVTTDKAFAESGSADQIFMDYVSLTFGTQLNSRPTSSKSPPPVN